MSLTDLKGQPAGALNSGKTPLNYEMWDAINLDLVGTGESRDAKVYLEKSLKDSPVFQNRWASQKAMTGSQLPQLDHADVRTDAEYDLKKWNWNWASGHGLNENEKSSQRLGRDAWNSRNKDRSRTRQKEDSKALVTIDEEGVDWTNHSEDEDYALMACNSSDSDKDECQPKVWSDAPIIEEYESDSEDEYVYTPRKEQETPSFANQQVKTPRETIKNQFTHSQKLKFNKTELGRGMARKAELNNGWNNVQRVNKQNQFVPSVVLTRTGKIPVSTARASSTKNLSTARQSFNRQTVLTSTAMKVNTIKPIVNRVRPANVFHKTHSPSLRPFKKTTVLRTDFSKQKVNTAKVNAVSTVGGKRETAVKSSAGHMDWNKAYLLNFKDFMCPVALEVVKVISLVRKGKQHKASYKAKSVSSVSHSLQLLHMDLFGPTSVRSLNHKTYCLVITDDFSRFKLKIKDVIEICGSKGSEGIIVIRIHNKMELLKERTGPLLRQEKEANEEAEALRKQFEQETENLVIQAGAAKTSSTNIFSTVSTPAKASSTNLVNTVSIPGAVVIQTWTNCVNVSSIPTSRNYLFSSSALILEKDDYDEFLSLWPGIEAIKDLFSLCLIIAFLDVYQLDVKKCLPLWTIDEELSVAGMQTLSAFLLKKGYRRDEFNGESSLFFLGIQVNPHADGIFISQDKYVAEILKKFDFANVKTASTPIETQKPLVKERPDIMFAVCACSRFWSLTSPSSSVVRAFSVSTRANQTGLWYPRVSSFDLESYSDSDYAGANLDRKSTIGGCQFLGRRLISWQCKKQTIMATSTTEAEYVAAASCCGQNPVYHSKTKHIAIRHHFIRDAYEKKLIQVLKIHTDDNVADLLTKAFDVSRVSLRRVIDGTEALLLSTLFILWLDIVSTDSAKLVPLGKVCTAIETLKKNTAKGTNSLRNLSQIHSYLQALISLLTTITLSTTMAVLDSCPKHNMVAYLEKSEGNAEFHEIIDFLKRSTLLPSSDKSVSISEDEGAPSERPSEAQPTPSPVPTSEIPIEPQTDSSPAHTKTSSGNLGGHSSSDKSLLGNEGELTLQSIYDLCLSLCAQVSDQAKEIQHLKAQIKKLKKQANPVIKHHRAWMQSISLKKRLARKKSSKKQWVHKESVSKQGRKFAKDVLSMDRKSCTNKEKVSTDRPIVSTDGSKVSTDKQIEGTDEQIKSTDEQRKHEKKFKQLESDEVMLRD
ncbi:hypothetical protein Tco_1493137 [Tanacetum coccineum]